MSFEYPGCKIITGILGDEVRRQANKAGAISGQLEYPIISVHKASTESIKSVYDQ